MDEYPKINSVFKRDQKGKFTEEYSTPEIEYLHFLDWRWDEKVDGTNVRVHWDQEKSLVKFAGRTERSELPSRLVDKLIGLFATKIFEGADLPTMTLYGEGYGAKIQKGGENYISDGCDFVIFDIKCGGLWLKRSDTINIAIKLMVNFIPSIPCSDISSKA